MSRQSKNAKNMLRAKEFTQLRKSGQHGPSSTNPSHGKKNVKWNSEETKKARAMVLGKSSDDKTNKTVLEKINEKKEKKHLQRRGNVSETPVVIEVVEIITEDTKPEIENIIVQEFTDVL